MLYSCTRMATVGVKGLTVIITVDDAQYSPQQEDNDDRQRFFALRPGDAFHEHEVKSERRDYYCTVEYLYNATVEYCSTHSER